MEQITLAPVTALLIAANVLASLFALANRDFMEKNLFHVGSILQGRQWHRMLTSGFLHGGFIHLLVNMYVLFNFGGFVESQVGRTNFLIIYFAALLGGNFWSLLENKNEYSYRALGASGATSGVVMVFILFLPFEPLMIFPIPFFFPAVILGLVFLVASAFLAQRPNKTIGHEAHLGGALAGILVSIAIVPGLFSNFSTAVAAALGGG